MPPAIVPATWIKRRELRYWMEALQCMNSPLTCGSLKLPPPVLGTYILLELSGNSFFIEPRTAGAAEAARAVAILQDGRAALPAVMAMIRDDFDPINAMMRRVVETHKEALVDHYDDIAAWIRDVPYYGFDMIPPSADAESEPFLFSGSTIGAVASLARERLGANIGDALWNIPVCLIGHLQAAHRKAEGDSVRRPDDREDIREQLRLARERNERGEPHPWELGMTRAEWDAMQASAGGEYGG